MSVGLTAPARQARPIRSRDLERPRPARQRQHAGLPGTRRRGLRRSPPKARPSRRPQDCVAAECRRYREAPAGTIGPAPGRLGEGSGRRVRSTWGFGRGASTCRRASSAMPPTRQRAQRPRPSFTAGTTSSPSAATCLGGIGDGLREGQRGFRQQRGRQPWAGKGEAGAVERAHQEQERRALRVNTGARLGDILTPQLAQPSLP
jgi:hypothetical protein